MVRYYSYMDWTLGIVLALLLANMGLVFFLWRKSQTAAPINTQDTQSMLMLQNQLAELTRAMDQKLGEGTKNMSEFMNTQSDQARSLMSTISKQVTEQLVEVTRGV